MEGEVVLPHGQGMQIEREEFDMMMRVVRVMVMPVVPMKLLLNVPMETKVER